MGTSVETEVEFVKLDRHDVQYWMLHEGKRYDDEPVWSEITHKARKKIADAQPGDIIEVVWDYDASQYPIVAARMVSGSAEEGVRLLTERLARLETILTGLPDVIRRSADSVSGERYEEARRTHHAVALAVEAHIKRDGEPESALERLGGSRGQFG